MTQEYLQNYLDREKEFWNVDSVPEAMFDRIFINSNNNLLNDMQKVSAFHESGKMDLAGILNNIPHSCEWRVLDIGCGIGRVLRETRKKFRMADGIDISEKMLEYSKNYLSGYDNGKVFQGNGYNLNGLEDEIYDFVYSIAVFQHIHSYTVFMSYIKDVKRVLKSGGYFRFQVHDTTADHFGGQMDEPEDSKTYGLCGNAYTPEQIDFILRDNGFDLVEVTHQSPWIWATAKIIKDSK